MACLAHHGACLLGKRPGKQEADAVSVTSGALDAVAAAAEAADVATYIAADTVVRGTEAVVVKFLAAHK